jgi:hypothetical protein
MRAFEEYLAARNIDKPAGWRRRQAHGHALLLCEFAVRPGSTALQEEAYCRA